MCYNVSMNTIKEFMNVIDERLKIMGISRWELLKRCGLSETLFTMALKRDMLLKIENIYVISKEINVSIPKLLGLEEDPLPDDIKIMEDMLRVIPEKDRKMISMNIQNYYNVAIAAKKQYLCIV